VPAGRPSAPSPVIPWPWKQKNAGKIAEGAPLFARWHKNFVYRLLGPAALSEAKIDEAFDRFDTADLQIGH